MPSSRPCSRRSIAQLHPADAPRRLVVQLYGSGIAIQAEQLWSRFRGVGRARAARRSRATRGPDAFLRGLFGGAPRAGATTLFAPHGRAIRRDAARRLDRRIGRGAPRLQRGHGCRRAAHPHRPQLRAPARLPRRADAGALREDPGRRREPAGVRRLRAQPADRRTGVGAARCSRRDAAPSSATCSSPATARCSSTTRSSSGRRSRRSAAPSRACSWRATASATR